MKEGQKVRTADGRIETILAVENCRIITYESMTRQNWYHPTKVWLVK